MNLQNEIKSLTLSFFETISESIVYDDGTYHISMGQKYHDRFGGKRISITFDGNSALKHGSELIVPGNHIFETIMDICTGKGPIAAKRSRTGGVQTVLRYHFFVSFSGKHSVSQLMHVDINPDTCSVERGLGALEDRMRPPNECINTKDAISAYLLASDTILAKSDTLRAEFIADATREFQSDLIALTKKHDDQIRELDRMINKKDDNDQRFRFETIDKIKDLESEKMRLETAVQERHCIHLEYNLIACEIIGP